MKYSCAAILCALCAAIPVTAVADEVDCASQCPSGKKMTSFSDGNNASCSCIDEAAGMDPTVANPEVIENESSYD